MQALLKMKKSRTPLIALADEPCREITLTHCFLPATDRRVSIDQLLENFKYWICWILDLEFSSTTSSLGAAVQERSLSPMSAIVGGKLSVQLVHAGRCALPVRNCVLFLEQGWCTARFSLSP